MMCLSKASRELKAALIFICVPVSIGTGITLIQSLTNPENYIDYKITCQMQERVCIKYYRNIIWNVYEGERFNPDEIMEYYIAGKSHRTRTLKGGGVAARTTYLLYAKPEGKRRILLDEKGDEQDAIELKTIFENISKGTVTKDFQTTFSLYRTFGSGILPVASFILSVLILTGLFPRKKA